MIYSFNKIVVLCVLVGLLIGCATEPKYQNYAGQDAACVKGHTANFFKFFVGDAHVHIKEIDGVPTGNSDPYCFAPGKHRLGVSAYNDYQMAQDYVDLDFEAGKQYQLRAKLQGISFIFQLMDITGSPETKVTEFTLKAGSSGQTVFVPVIIPSK